VEVIVPSRDNMAMGSDMGWYLVISLWSLAAGGVCFFDCAYRKIIMPKTYVGNVLLTVVMGALYTFLPLMVIGSNTTKPLSTYLLAVYLVAFVLGIIFVKFFVARKTHKGKI
jgi:hypothetical protein